MAGSEQESEDEPKKKGGIKGLMIGIFGAILLGGGGFYAMSSGLIHLPQKSGAAAHESSAVKVAFIPLDPIVVTINGSRATRQLRVTIQLDVPPDNVDEVTAVLPRVLDVLNAFLRAVGEQDLADAGAFPRIQSQMLRRAQVIVGEGKINDLLVTEFILN